MRLPLIGLIGVVVAVLAACSRSTPPVPPAPGAPQAAAPAAAAESAAESSEVPSLVSGDADGLRSYLRTVRETPARRFDVDWNPDVVRIDRDTALRTLHSISQDGAEFRFAAGDPALSQLRPGRILFLWGLAVRRIRSADETNGELVLRTDVVSLTEVFRNANIELEYDVRPQSPIVVPHVQAATAPATPAAALRGESGGFLRVRHAAEEPPASRAGGGASTSPANDDKAPTDDNAAQPADHVLPLGLDSWGVKGYHGFDISAKYGPSGDGIAFELQARLAQPDLSDTSAAPDQSGDEKAGKGVGKDFQKLEEDQRKKTVQGIRDVRSKSDVEKASGRQIASADAAKADAKARKEGYEKGIADAAQHFSTMLSVGSGLWDMRLGVSGKIHAPPTGDTLRVAGNIVIKDSALSLMRTDFNNASGDLALFFIFRRGEKSEQWIAAGPLKVELPIRFNIPVIVGGLPFMFQVAFNFIAQPALTTKNDAFTARYEVPFHGSGSISLSGGKLETSGTLTSVPAVKEALASSIGVSAILIAVQAPRLGFGLGLFSASSVAYVDLVNSFTITSGGQLGLFPCKRHNLISGINVGIDTQIALPLDGWAKLLGKPLSSTLDEINKAASTRKQMFRKEWVRTEPQIKACELSK